MKTITKAEWLGHVEECDGLDLDEWLHVADPRLFLLRPSDDDLYRAAPWNDSWSAAAGEGYEDIAADETRRVRLCYSPTGHNGDDEWEPDFIWFDVEET